MSDVIRSRFTVVVDLDPDVWDMNYATDNVAEDIASYMPDVIASLINRYIADSGNTGMSTVKVASKPRKVASK